MGVLGKLKGGSQILAKTALANYIVEVENNVPVDREQLLRRIQDKCKLVEEADFGKLVHDVNALCEPIKNQQLDYIDRAGNITLKAFKLIHSPEKVKNHLEAAGKQLASDLEQAASLQA